LETAGVNLVLGEEISEINIANKPVFLI